MQPQRHLGGDPPSVHARLPAQRFRGGFSAVLKVEGASRPAKVIRAPRRQSILDVAAVAIIEPDVMRRDPGHGECVTTPNKTFLPIVSAHAVEKANRRRSGILHIYRDSRQALSVTGVDGEGPQCKSEENYPE